MKLQEKGKKSEKNTGEMFRKNQKIKGAYEL